MGLVDISKRLVDVEAQCQYIKRWVTQNDSLLTSVAAFDERLSNLEGTTTNEFADKMQQYASLFNDHGHGFIFFTDPHDMSGFPDYDILMHFNALRTVYSNTPARYVLCGGDWLNQHHTLAEAKYRVGRVPNMMRTLIAEKSYTAVGNHDLNAESPADTEITETELARIWFNQDVAYYNVEDTDTNCFIFDSGKDVRTMTAYRWTQVAWFVSKLLSNTKPHVFGLIHIIGHGPHDLYPEPHELGDNLTKVANAYNQKTSITLNGSTYDFSNATGTFHFMLAGHFHEDMTETENNIPIFYTGAYRIIDCCYADWETSKLNMIRVGLGKNIGNSRVFDFIASGSHQVSQEG